MKNGVSVKLSLDLEDWLKEMGYECAKETALALVQIFQVAAGLSRRRRKIQDKREGDTTDGAPAMAPLSIPMLRWILRSKIKELRLLVKVL